MKWLNDFLKFVQYIYTEAEYEFWHSKFGQDHCRHPGVWWYNNSDRLEPDMHCKKCGLDIG